MCYSVYFSTDSGEDFADLESEYFSVCPYDIESDSEADGLLGYGHWWRLVSRYGGCSCHFRHSAEGEFGPVEDWCPEDNGDVEATGCVYDLFCRVVAEGHRLDVVDIWSDTPVEDIRSIGVFLNGVPRDHFRFHEDVRFELLPEAREKPLLF